MLILCLQQKVNKHFNILLNYQYNNHAYFEKMRKLKINFLWILGCWRGYWGPNCTKSCPVECINQDCFPVNGSCVWGCDLQNCFHGKCNTNTNVCTEGCLNGRVGRHCSHCMYLNINSLKINTISNFIICNMFYSQNWNWSINLFNFANQLASSPLGIR